MSDSLVSIRDLWVRLGGTDILKGVGAEIARGKITALIGLNGSGKTTLLKALLKEIPYTGEIEFHCGHDHRRPTPQHVGYVPQKLRIDANLPLTVRDLLALALQRRPLFLGVSRRVEKLIGELLDQVGAPRRLLDCYVEKISGGELQRVLLGLAIQPEPELLLLDEPAAGIDSASQGPFYGLIDRLNQQHGVTVLLVSHDLSMVGKHAHEVICLRQGRIECHGPPDHITPEAMRQTFGTEMGIYAHRHA
jgi:zinc transport system ATP-binding protein